MGPTHYPKGRPYSELMGKDLFIKHRLERSIALSLIPMHFRIAKSRSWFVLYRMLYWNRAEQQEHYPHPVPCEYRESWESRRAAKTSPKSWLNTWKETKLFQMNSQLLFHLFSSILERTSEMLIGIKSLYDVGVLILGMGMTSACFQQNGKTLLAMQKFIM